MHFVFKALLLTSSMCVALECYTGSTFIRGQTISQTERCKSASDMCYNATADASPLARIQMAGCSSTRCYLARNKCRTQSVGGHNLNFCCCNTGDLCNAKSLSLVQKAGSKITDILSKIG